LPWLAPRIGVVELFGVLGTTIRGPDYDRMLSTLRDDARVRAVVVDIDSPGGSAPAAEQIHRGIAKIAAKKPVIAIRPVVAELLQRLGVKVFVTKAGAFKDMFQPFREPTDEEQKKLQTLMDEYYDWFVNTVASTRQLEPEKVRGLATGEVFTARTAKELGLVDELGDLDTAIDMATELGRVPRRLAYLRPRRAILERLVGRVATGLVEQVAAEAEQRLLSRIEFRA
jgi:protease-4